MQHGLDFTCPVCRSAGPEVFFELTGVPVHCNIQHDTRAQAQAAARGDLRLALCRACGMIWNAAFRPELLRYGAGYENALHWSPAFARYAREQAARLVREHGIQGGTIVEIGCGDGHFLSLLCREAGCRGMGFDPGLSADSVRAPESGIELVRGPFSPSLVPGAARMVCCRHVLEHVPDPRAFLAGIRGLAARAADTVLYLEIPDARAFLERGAVFDILYEHCSYFTAASLARLLAETGWRALSVAAAFFGQFLAAEAVPAAGPAAPPSAGDEPGPQESARRFAAAYQGAVARWRGEVERLTRAGRRVALWGAGTKGVMFLNALGAAALQLQVFDLNPRKQGRHVALTGQRIDPPERLRDEPPDVVLVMNSAYLEEIRGTMQQFGVRAALVSV